MKAILRVLLKNFLLAKSKFVLCVLAAVLSSWGVSVVMYGYFMSERDFKENFTATLPLDIALNVIGDDDAIEKVIAADPAIVGVERRGSFSGRIKNKSGNWMPLQMFSVREFNNASVGKVKILTEKAAPSPRIFIERNAVSYLDTAKSFEIQFPGKEPLSFSFAGTTFDPALPPAQMDRVVFAYVDLATASLARKDSATRFIVRVKDERRTNEELKKVAASLKSSIEAAGGKVITQFIPPAGEHPHQNIVDGISFLQRNFGAVLSVLGVILLSLILITWLYPQVTLIGISKAVGASTSKLFRSYAIVLMLVISLGSAVGIPLGFFTAAKYNGFIAFLQNFIPVTDAFPIYIHLWVALVVFALPMAIALLPLRSFTAKSVHDSISQIFYTPYKGMFKLSQRAFANVPFKYSFNNLFRNNQRTFLLLVLLTIGIGLMITGFNLRHSINREFDSFVKASPYDVVVSLKDSLPHHKLDFLEQETSVVDYSLFRADRVTFKTSGKAYMVDGMLTTFSSTHRIPPSLVIAGAIKPGCSDCVYLGQKLMPDFEGLQLGDTLDVANKNGNRARMVFTGVIRELLFASLYRISDDTGRYYQNVSIERKKGLSSDEGLSEIDAAFLDHGIEVRNISSAEIALSVLDNHLQPTYLIIKVMGYVTVAIALAGLMIVLSLSLKERDREVGIMKAIGSTSLAIAMAFQREFLLVTLAACTFGLLAGNAMNAAICKLFGTMLIEAEIPPQTNWIAVAIILVTLIVIQVAAVHFYIVAKVRRTSRLLLSEVV